jgi:hypothetical protein
MVSTKFNDWILAFVCAILGALRFKKEPGAMLGEQIQDQIKSIQNRLLHMWRYL